MFTKKLHKQWSSLIFQVHLLAKRDLQQSVVSSFPQHQQIADLGGRRRPMCLCEVIGRKFQDRIPYDIPGNNYRRAHTYLGNMLQVIPKEIQKKNCDIMSNLLGIQVEDVSRIPKKEINEDRALQVYRVLKEFGFSSSALCLYPELLLMNHGAVENYIRIMQESGFTEVREVFILRFRTVCKQTIQVLHKKGMLPKIEAAIERHCVELGETSEFFKYLMDSLPDEKERISLFDFRNHIISAYFSKLALGTHEDNKTTFKKYPRINYKPANWMKRTYQLLTEKLEFSNLKIRKHLYLLHTDPNNLERVIHIPTLGGMELKKLAQNTKCFAKALSSGGLRNRGVDVITFIADYLQADRKLFRESLIRHPHLLYIPLMNLHSVLTCIQKLHSFSKEQLINAAPLLLYPIENVEKEVENVLNLGEAKLTDEYFLQMVLYFLERQAHFTGDAVWHDKDVRQDLEDDEGEEDKHELKVD